MFVRIGLSVLIICGATMQLNGQTHKTHSAKMSFTQKFPACELVDDIEVNLTAYYDDNDNDIYHGPFSAKHLRNLNANGVVGKLEYTSSGTYVDGKLDGTVNITIVETFSRPQSISMKTALVASYKNGVPTGKWVVSEQGTQGKKQENYSITAVYEDGEITTFSTTKGSHVTFKLIGTEESWGDLVKKYEVSGKWGDVTYVNGLNCNRFVKKNGSTSEVDDEVKAILDDYAKEKITESDLMQKGYVKEFDEELTEDIFGYWDELLGIRGGWNVYGLGITQYDKSKEGFRYRTGSKQLHRYYVYKLHRVAFSPASTIIALLEEQGVNSKESLVSYREKVSTNRLGDYFFNDEEKAKIIEYIDEKISVVTRVESLKDSLNNGVTKFLQKYQSKSYLEDERLSFNDAYQRTFLYNRGNSNDSTKLKEYLTLLSLYDEICQTTVDLYQGGGDILSKTKSSYPKINQIYKKMFESYDDTCPKDKSKLPSYLQQIKDWRNDQLLTNAYIALLPAIDDNAQKIASSSNGDVVKSYKAAEKSAEYAYSAEVQKSLNNAKAWLAKQEQYVELDGLENTVCKNDAQIAELSGKNFADVQKNFANYRKQNPVELTDDIAATIESNKKVIDMQNGCLNFLNERVKIFEDNVKIVEEGKACKNILKVYTSYMKNVDLSWSETVNVQKLLDVESIQAKFEKAFSRPDAAQLDTEVKKSKDKTIETVLNIISK